MFFRHSACTWSFDGSTSKHTGVTALHPPPPSKLREAGANVDILNPERPNSELLACLKASVSGEQSRTGLLHRSLGERVSRGSRKPPEAPMFPGLVPKPGVQSWRGFNRLGKPLSNPPQQEEGGKFELCEQKEPRASGGVWECVFARGACKLHVFAVPCTLRCFFFVFSRKTSQKPETTFHSRVEAEPESQRWHSTELRRSSARMARTSPATPSAQRTSTGGRPPRFLVKAGLYTGVEILTLEVWATGP